MNENEYYLLLPTDLHTYPLIYEDCHRFTCNYEQYKDCDKVPDCPAYYKKKNKLENPRPFIMDFFSPSKNPVIFADIYLPFSLSGSSFVVSPKFHNLLNPLNIEGIQFIPVTLMENNRPKFTDFFYVHIYNYLHVLSSKNTVYQKINGRKITNNILQIKFNSQKMNKIPLSNRLIFKLPSDRYYFLIHSSIAEKIISLNPIGISLLKISNVLNTSFSIGA